MFRRLPMLLTILGFALLLVVAGCSDDDNNPAGSGSSNSPINLVDITEVIREVAPPEYSAPSAAVAADSFEIWTEGEYALLSKVFGNEDPQTLYRNIDDFEVFMNMIQQTVLVDDNGDPVLGSYTDTISDTVGGEAFTMYGTAVVTELTTATTIAAAYQGILGTSIDLDYLVSVTVAQMSGGVLKVGMKVDSNQQTLLVYQVNMSGEVGATESSIVYATLDPSDSTFQFKGIVYTEDQEEVFSTSFIMTSESDGDFAYRMSWFSDDIPAPDYTLLGCIIGGGNKDVEFGMKYRQYTPADDTSMDTEWSFDEVFGPNYTNGTGLITDYSTYVNEELVIGYSLVPQAMLTNPWAE